LNKSSFKINIIPRALFNDFSGRLFAKNCCATTNVNGIRAAEKKGFFDWIKTQDADVVCLQEIKAQEDQLDERFYPKEYHCYYQSAEKKGYSGTAIFSKQAPTKIIKESPWDDINFEGRFIQADFKDFSVISIYIHSGSAKQERQDLKMAFLSERFMPYLQELKASGRKVIICGDVNIVHQERDIKNWKANQKNSGCLPQERAWLDELFFEVGFIDGFREVNQASHQYTWYKESPQASHPLVRIKRYVRKVTIWL
jgi:exodeoxyribonuclease-3